MAVSKDGAHSWRQVPMTGFSYTPHAFDAVSRVIPSPEFARDHAAYAFGFNGGLQVTTDDGQTFQPVLPMGGDESEGQGGALAAVNAYEQSTSTPLGAVPDDHTYFTLPGDPSSGSPSMRLDATMRVPEPITGAPGPTVLFVVPPVMTASSTPLALAYQPSTAGHLGPLTVYSCTTDLTCAQPLYTFPTDQAAPEIWVGPAPKTVTVLFGTSRQFWRSTDGGHSFSPWRSANALYPGAHAGIPALAINPARPKELFLLESRGPISSAPSVMSFVRLYRSDDGGSTWHQVAFDEVLKSGPKGNLPVFTTNRGGLYGFALLPDGRLLLSGGSMLTHNGSQTLAESIYCSLDGGTHWSPRCPK